eukprot:s1693_g4.t2
MELGAAPSVELDRAFRGHRGPVTCVAFHPEEQQVVSGSQDGCLFVWHFKPQLRPFRFVGHKGEVHHVAMSRTGQTIASAAADQTVRLWSNSAQGESRVMKVHCGAVRSVCFSWDDSLLLTASDDKTVKLWSLATYRFQASLLGHTNWAGVMGRKGKKKSEAHLSDPEESAGGPITLMSTAMVGIGDPPQPFLVVRLHRSEEYWSSNAAGLLDMCLAQLHSPDKAPIDRKEMTRTDAWKKTLGVPLAARGEVHDDSGEVYAAYGLASNLKQRSRAMWLAVAISVLMSSRMAPPLKAKFFARFPGLEEVVRQCQQQKTVFFLNRETVKDEEIYTFLRKLSSWPSGDPRAWIAPGDAPCEVYSADFSKNSELVASAGEDRLVRIWDVEKKVSIMTFPDFQVPVSKVKFHPDGSSVAACGKDGCIKLWDLRSRKLLQHYDAHSGAVASIDFHPTGEQLLSAGEDGLRIWNLREGRLMHEVSGLKKPPTACAFSPSGQCLAAGSRDHLVLTWNFKADGPAPAAPAPRHPVSTPERAATTAPRRNDATTKPRAAPAAAPPEPAADATTKAVPAEEMPATPEPLAETLKTMQSHLEIMARTVQLLDQRLALNEEQVKAMRSELLQQNALELKVPLPVPLPVQQAVTEVKSLTTQEEELQKELENLRQLL